MTQYTERESQPEERDRGKVLDALAAGDLWIFVRADISEGADGPEIDLKMECTDLLDGESVKALLIKTVQAMP